MEKKKRNRSAERTVKCKLKKTHLKNSIVVGSESADEGTWDVFFIRPVGLSNYLYKINVSGQNVMQTGIIPVKNPGDYPEYSQNAPVAGTVEALKPTESEKRSFKGYK